MSYQSGCFDPLAQSFPTQQPTVSPVPMDPKLPSYPSQFTPASQAQLPPELATVGPQGQGFGAPQAAFPVGTTGIGLRPGVMRPQGPQLRLSPNQLRLQLQQRLQGPQQVRTCLCSGGRYTVRLCFSHSVSCYYDYYSSPFPLTLFSSFSISLSSRADWLVWISFQQRFSMWTSGFVREFSNLRYPHKWVLRRVSDDSPGHYLLFVHRIHKAVRLLMSSRLSIYLFFLSISTQVKRQILTPILIDLLNKILVVE